jgi:hypothetical protein
MMTYLKKVRELESLQEYLRRIKGKKKGVSRRITTLKGSTKPNEKRFLLPPENRLD